MLDLILLIINANLSFWFVEITSDRAFESKPLPRFIMSLFFVATVYIHFYGELLIFARFISGTGIWVLVYYLGTLICNPLLVWLTFVLGNALMPGFKVHYPWIMKRCVYGFFVFNSVGFLFINLFNFFGGMMFAGAGYRQARHDTGWFYHDRPYL
jgi:hypothetical protein